MAISARELTLILRVQSAGAQNIRRLQADLNGLERGAGSMGQRFAMASQAIGAVGRQMQLAGGIGTFALGLAANQAAQLSTKVTLAATQVTHGVAQTRKQATQDFQGILDQMSKFPTSADDMAAALYDVYSTLNVTGRQGIPILQQINKAAVAGGLTAQEAGQGLLSIISNFDKGRATVQDATKDFNTMFAAVRYGRATMADLSTALATTAPAAKIAGQSLQNMAGTFAFLSRSLGPQKAAVSYARLVEVLSGTQMQKGLREAGVNIDTANGKMKNMDEVIRILIHRFPYLTQGGVKALNFFKDIGNIQSTIQARRAFATLVSNFTGYRDILHKTINDNNEFRKSYAAMAQSPGVQWNVLINNLKAVGLQIGMAVLPAFVSMSKYIREAVEWFNKLSPSTKDLIGKFAAFGAVGALIGGTLLTIAAAAGGAVVAVAGLGDALAVFGAGVFTYAGLAALAKHIYDNWDELGGLMKKVGSDIKRILEDLANAVKAFYQGDWQNVWSSLGDAIQTAIPTVIDALDLLKASVFAWFKDFFSSAQGIITAGVTGMFAMNRFRGGSALAGKTGTALSTTDLLSLAIGAPVGPMAMFTKGAAKADDIAQARENFLKKIGGTEGIKRTLAMNPYQMGGNKLAPGQVAALEQYVKQEEDAARREASVVGRMRSTWKAGAADRVKFNQALREPVTRNVYNPFRNLLTPNINQETKQIGTLERNARLAGKALSDGLAVGAVGASASLEKMSMSMSSAGKNMLSFLGFGSPILGGLVAISAAAYVGGTAISRYFDPATLDIKKLNDSFDNAQAGIKSFRDGIYSTAESFYSLRSARQQLSSMTKSVNAQRDALSKLTPGTAAYARANKQLTAALQARAQQQLAVNQAQDAANAAAAQANQGAGVATTGINNAAALLQGRISGSAGTGGDFSGFLDTYTNGLKTIQSAAQNLLPNIQALNAAIASGVNPAGMKMSFGEIAATYGAILRQGKAWVKNLQDVMVATGHAFNPAELQFFAQNINKNILPGVAAIARHIHALPSKPVIRFLSNHKDVQLGIAAIVDQFNRLPNRKEMKMLLNHPGIDQWIANFINRFHKIPTHKQISIHIKNTEQARREIEQTERKIGNLQRAAHQVGRIGGPGNVRVNTSAIDAARRKITQLNRDAQKQTTHRIKVAFNPNPDKIAQSYQSLVGKMSTIGTQAGTGWAGAFSKTAQGTATAHVNVVISAFKKSYQISSPSKVMKKQIGDPVLQGILEPLKDKQSIKDAANTAMSNMIDAFNAARDTYKSQLGDLFAGPTFMGPNQEPPALQQKLQWGEPVNIQDLRGDLNAQYREFSKFQHSLNRLNRRRGTSFAFIDEIRQLGPAAQSEVNALLHATPRQLRQYERLWERSQRAVNNTARRTVQSQVAAWKKQGAAVALGFMSGMQQHSAQMARFFHNLFMRLFNEVKHTHKSHSPSKLYMEEGMNVMQGFKLGVVKGSRPIDMPKLHAPVERLRHARPLVQNITNNYYNRTYNIYPQKEENFLSALRKHDAMTRVHP